jgi:K+:H+ antiporter
LHQPRVIGEILAGIVLGPFVLGRLPAYTRLLQLDVAVAPKEAALDMLYFLAGACVIKVLSVALGARLAGFKGLDLINLSVATNALGGPGIVLASVAYQAGIISGAFYTTLVLVAVLTSQAASAWLEFVLRKGWQLLSESTQPSVAGTQPRDILAGTLLDAPPEKPGAAPNPKEFAA